MIDTKGIVGEFDQKITALSAEQAEKRDLLDKIRKEKAEAIRQVFFAESEKMREEGKTAMAVYLYAKGQLEALSALGKKSEEFLFWNIPDGILYDSDKCSCCSCEGWRAFLYDYNKYPAIFLAAVGEVIRRGRLDENNLSEDVLRAEMAKGRKVIEDALNKASKLISGGASIAEVIFKSMRLNCAHEIIIRAYKEDKELLSLLLPSCYTGLLPQFREAEAIKQELVELKAIAEKAENLVNVAEILQQLDNIKERIKENPYTVYVAGISDDDLKAPKRILEEKTKFN